MSSRKYGKKTLSTIISRNFDGRITGKLSGKVKDW